MAPEGFSRVRFVTSGSDANETSIQLARSYHVERGEPSRWQVISFAQAYHGPTMETLALTGRPGLHGPFGPYLPQHLHIPPSTSRSDPTGQVGPRRARPRPRTERDPRPSRRSSARRSAPRRCPRRRRLAASGRAWPNAATATGSWSASTRWSPGSGERVGGSPARGRRARRTSSRPRRASAPGTRRSARCCAASPSTRPSRTARVGSPSVTPGTARRSRAPWGSRSWRRSGPRS